MLRWGVKAKSMSEEQIPEEATAARRQRQVPLPKLNVQVNWRAVVAESLFISASILFAFALQDWDEVTDIEERTLIALCNVKSELEFNRILLEKDFMPRQQGMLALSRASISLLRSNSEEEVQNAELTQLMVKESIRHSAWTLASESGYLLHANFQLATEIGALLDFQEERYQAIVELVYDAVYEHDSGVGDSPVDYYLNVSNLVTEWIGQTDYLRRKYGDLFAREDFSGLPREA